VVGGTVYRRLLMQLDFIESGKLAKKQLNLWE
jgi:hypothetical protein